MSVVICLSSLSHRTLDGCTDLSQLWKKKVHKIQPLSVDESIWNRTIHPYSWANSCRDTRTGGGGRQQEWQSKTAKRESRNKDTISEACQTPQSRDLKVLDHSRPFAHLSW